MKTHLSYGIWLLIRHFGIAGLTIVAFPVMTAGFYVVASVAGGHTNSDKGDLVMAIPFAGAAFLVACIFTLLMLLPAMLVSDIFRLFKGWHRWRTLLPGLVTVLLALLPWQLTAADGFSWRACIIGGGMVAVVFCVYWGACQSVDFLAERFFRCIKEKIKPICNNNGEQAVTPNA